MMRQSVLVLALSGLFALPMLLALPAAAHAGTLQVTVHGVRNGRGHIRIGVCRKAEFLSETCFRHAVVPAHPGDVSVSIQDLAPGQYGIAAYQDEDDSGRLKRNFFGMPQEDLGFSRDPSTRFGPPAFADSALTIGNNDSRIVLTLRHLGR